MPNTSLDIATFTLGDYQTNCYVVSDAASKACWLVDTGFGPGAMIEHVQQAGLTPVAVVLTHAHVDHIAGLAEVLERFKELDKELDKGPDKGLDVLIHTDEMGFPEEPAKNLSIFLGTPVTAPPATRAVTQGEILTLGAFEFEVRHTPGHSPGGISLVQHDQKVVLVGDALFRDAIGRFDFPTSDGRALIEGIHAQLMTLPDDYRVLSGHGPETTIGRERTHNPYLRETGLA
ncbi:MAG: MBL fold metallo-hydrolase [Algisphaera sp.]